MSRPRALQQVQELDALVDDLANEDDAEDLKKFLRAVPGSVYYEKSTLPAHIWNRSVDEIRAVLRAYKKEPRR